ncbi:hypothetical protein [Halorubrum tropicale]|uniref:Uncharacterized protein n=1 Tax=Halorubrum tropicale TaxID=1765655 RepID=A0A0N0BN89_9EURY|nr:hypothetical protein [Halorubrum tropicale]KOX92144.1 hypothetical protein AMR74_17010 [Halorubrum tropicale]
MSDDHTLTLTVRGTARFETATEADGLGTITATETREVTADLDVDGDRLHSSDLATTHRSGATISTSDVAEIVAGELDAAAVDVDGWEVTLSASLDDWQKTVLEAAEKRRQFESDQVDTALDVLLSLHERHAKTDRPIYAALNIDETYGAGRREELLGRLVDEGPDAEATAEAEEVA